MKITILYIILLFAILPCVSRSQCYTFKETKTDTIKRSFKKILIVGVGKTATRFFVDQVTKSLITKFKSIGVEVEYAFLGDDNAEANIQVKRLLAQNFNALITFDPIDSLFQFSSNSLPPIQTTDPHLGVPTYQSPLHLMSYEDAFNVNFYDLTNGKKVIWSSLLKITCLLDKKREYSEIAKILIASLKSSNILQ